MIKFIKEWISDCLLSDESDGYFLANIASTVLSVIIISEWVAWVGGLFSGEAVLKSVTLPAALYLISLLQFYFSEHRSRKKDD